MVSYLPKDCGVSAKNKNSKVFLCQGDITKINVDGIVNATSETLISEGGIDGAIHELAGPGLLHEFQKLNAC